MESPSVPTRRGRVPWQGLLLAGYVWFKGESVDSSRQIASYVIDTQQMYPGPEYSGRETIHPNGSLLLQKVTLKDTGYYTLLGIKRNFQGDKGTGQLRVYLSLLTSWSPPTTAQLTVESVPPSAAEGEDVLLRVHDLPGFLAGYVWFKGESVDSSRQIASYVIDTQEIHPGPEYSGRETIHPNGSLLLQKVTLKDTGYYTLLGIKRNFQGDKGTGQLRVYQPVGKPSIRARNSSHRA
ncbi:cell adhesion molecule CEACAM3-like isoform 2-T2 [Molossus nigricans]